MTKPILPILSMLLFAMSTSCSTSKDLSPSSDVDATNETNGVDGTSDDVGADASADSRDATDGDGDGTLVDSSMSCPSTEPTPGAACTWAGVDWDCTYGTDGGCTETCHCTKTGFTCGPACPPPPPPTCPDVAPVKGAPCTVDLLCFYPLSSTSCRRCVCKPIAVSGSWICDTTEDCPETGPADASSDGTADGE